MTLVVLSILFLSRRGLVPRRNLRLGNESEVLAYLRTKISNLEVISPEKPISDQILLNNNSHLVVCAVGSAAYTALTVSPEKPLVLMICPYIVSSLSDWGHTLRHFWHVRDQIILISPNSSRLVPSGATWDVDISVDVEDLYILISLLSERYKVSRQQTLSADHLSMRFFKFLSPSLSHVPLSMKPLYFNLSYFI